MLSYHSTSHHKKNLLFPGNVSEDQLDQWCKEIDEEESRKEQEALSHAQWLKEREARKQEIERAWRPLKTVQLGLKRKTLDSLDSPVDTERTDELQQQFGDTTKSAISPLLTSLLKSPSHVSNISTSSMLQTSISTQRTVNAVTNPTIASLLSSSPGVTVSPSLQHLVSSAISQDSVSSVISTSVVSPTPDLLEDATDDLPNLKMEDLECSILSSDEPLPEIKNEEVEVIISDLIENADDIVNHPEQHLKIDDNEDIITNLENVLEELEEDEKEGEDQPKTLQIGHREKEQPKVDPFEFEEDPEVFPPTKPSSLLAKQQQQQQQQDPMKIQEQQQHLHYQDKYVNNEEETKAIEDSKEHKIEMGELKNKDRIEAIPGSVEIVEVVVMEDDEMEKQLNKSQIQDIVHSHKPQVVEEKEIEGEVIKKEIKEEADAELSEPDKIDDCHEIFAETPADSDVNQENKEASIDLDVNEFSRRNTFTPEFSQELYDDLNIEVTKLDKSGKAKRDYSRTKKKDFDILLAVEKAVNAQLEENELTEDTFSDDKEYRDADKKNLAGTSSKVKSENERSNSSWTEEEDMFVRSKRRYSTPATPSDSVPNSPASSTACYEDERDYRNWKKSVMLVYNRLTTHKYASLFLKPITDDQAPGYHSVIYRPMDLHAIRKNIENGTIRTNMELKRDVLLMFTNAIMYNKTNDHVYNMTRKMQTECLQQIQLFFHAQAQTDAPPRRETRTSESGNKRKRVSEDFTKIKKHKED